MRVTCGTIEDFLENLASAESVFQRTVWVSIVKNPHDNGVKFQIGLQASAVAVYMDGMDTLVEVGIDCGPDYIDASQDFSGTEKAAISKKQISEYSEERGWQVLPGTIDT